MITLPSAQAKGGVAQFYNALLPYLPESIETVEIGCTNRAGGLFYPLADQFRFRWAVQKERPVLIHINPSLDFKCFVRDGLFAWQAQRMNKPFLVFWHGWDKNFEPVLEEKYLGLFRKTFGQANGHIVLASEFERKLKDWGVTAPVYRETTCVDDSLLLNFDVYRKWDTAKPLSLVKILFLARLERAKGV